MYVTMRDVEMENMEYYYSVSAMEFEDYVEDAFLEGTKAFNEGLGWVSKFVCIDFTETIEGHALLIILRLKEGNLAKIIEKIVEKSFERSFGKTGLTVSKFHPIDLYEWFGEESY